jgi:hypothetical protein
MKYGFKWSAVTFLVGMVAWTMGSLPSAVAEGRAHQHGVGQLNIAIEGNHLEIELILPGSDAVGFEHAPSTREDRRAVRSAADRLKDGGRLFVFPAGAGCRFEKAELHSSLLEAPEQGGHHEHKAHGHHDDKNHDPKENHAEFRVHYHVECTNLARLTHLDVTFFEAFPSAHRLETRWISPRRQGAGTLTGSSVRLAF